MIHAYQPETAARNDRSLADADLDKVSGGLIVTALFLVGTIVNMIKPGAIPFLPSGRRD